MGRNRHVSRLNVEFGDEMRFTYVMGGLAREFGPAPRIIADWLEAGELRLAA